MSDSVDVTGHLDLSKVDDAFGRVGARAKDLKSALREIRTPLIADQKAHAKDRAGPDGKWAARSPITEARRLQRNRASKAGAGRAVRRSANGARAKSRRSTPASVLGRLPTARRTELKADSIRVYSPVKWADAHMSDHAVGRRHASKLPGRPFMWLSDQVVEKSRAIFQKHIQSVWKK